MPANRPLVSVVVPSGRGPAAAAECVRFIRAGAGDLDIEVIVVADGERWTFEPEPVEGATVVRSASPGPAGTRNTGLRLARGEFIASIDDDVRPRPGWLAALLAVMADGVGAAGGPVRAYQPHTYIGHFSDWQRPLDPHPLWAEVPGYLVTANALFRRSALEQVGHFDERFPFPGGEDVELTHRLQAAGWTLAFARDAVVDHEFDTGWRRLFRTHLNYGRGTAMADSIAGLPRGRGLYLRQTWWYLWHWKPWKHRLDYALLERVLAVTRLVGMLRLAGWTPPGHGRPGDHDPDGTVAVVIPTRNRPEKLDRCLDALERQRDDMAFSCHVFDSTPDPELAARVAEVCAAHDWVTLHLHQGANAAAARNQGVRRTTEDVLISCDDDIRLEPGAVRELVEALRRQPPESVVAGSVKWRDDWSAPVVIRRISYGRKARPGERPDFLIGALFAYPRRVAEKYEWQELIRNSEDVYMGALWRSHGVHLSYAPRARAVHDDEINYYGVHDQVSHVYANLFDAAVANPSIGRLLSYELIGFVAGFRNFAIRRHETRSFFRAWWRGHRAFVRDLRVLRATVRRRPA